VPPRQRAHRTAQSRSLFRLGKLPSSAPGPNLIGICYRLTANYAPYPDGNVPRQGLYFSYRRVCDQYGIPHINTATLGKAIRLCFPTIKTRRLGVRGNSKYHCTSINCSITVLKRHIAIQIVVSARPPLQKPNGCKITSGSLTTTPHSNLSMLLALPANKPKHRYGERNVPMKTKRRTRRVQALAMRRNETLWR
jgi:hypothetical protein